MEEVLLSKEKTPVVLPKTTAPLEVVDTELSQSTSSSLYLHSYLVIWHKPVFGEKLFCNYRSIGVESC